MPHFLVTEAHGPAWDENRTRRTQAGFADHAAFVDALVEQGTVLLGGPLGEDVDAGDALLVVCADDETGVHHILAQDPWRDTILTITCVQRWTLWLRPPGVHGS